MIERRREFRTETYLPLRVWGIDTTGERFLQEARARDISLSGALLSHLDADLRSGDLIGVFYAGRSARFRVVWVSYRENGGKVQVAIQRVAADECPWRNLLQSTESAAGTTAGGS